MSTETIAQRFGSGHSVRRIEDDALLTGRGRYTDDVANQGYKVLCFLRSPHAHARILSIDIADAQAMPGVHAVLTGESLLAAGVGPLPTVPPNFKRPDGSPAASPPRHPLAVERVRYVGEPVAAVIADDRSIALDACEAIFVDYEDMPAAVDQASATAAGAIPLCEEAPDNIAAEMRHGDAQAAADAFARAAHRVTLTLANQRLAAAPIEPRSVAANYDTASERLTVRLSSQMPTGVRNTLADNVLRVDKERIRVVVDDVGGGFGMKTGLYPEDGVVAFAALHLELPVKWIADRSEEMLSASAGRDLRTRAELALDADGRILALRVRSQANVGAYASATAVAIQLLIGPWVQTSIYDIGLIDLQLQAILTNTASTGAYRGAGRPENIHIMERLMDEASRVTGIDQREIRRRNMIRPEQMPFTNAMGQVYDSGRFESILDQGIALADWDGFEERAAQSAARGLLRGRGLATFLEWTGGNALEEHVSVRVSADGYIEIVTATQAMGQGIATSYAQLAVDAFGVPIERIRIVQGDTDRANGFGSAGSRSLFTGGSALDEGAHRTIDHARELAAEALEVAADDVEYRQAQFTVVGTDRGIGLFDLAARQPGNVIDVNSSTKVGGPTWPNGCHVCEVEIDPETGVTRVASYASCNDVGRVINPMIVVGQLEGGAVQGIGQALCEEVVYEADSGQLQTGSFMDYAMPRADLVGEFRTTMDTSIPCLTNPLGVKGVGELGTIGATPATVNAVVDALSRAGRHAQALELQMPLTAPKIWTALQGG